MKNIINEEDFFDSLKNLLLNIKSKPNQTNQYKKEPIDETLFKDNIVTSDDTIYIHYGTDDYDESKFKPIRNKLQDKPARGLWACPVNVKGYRTWANWLYYSNMFGDETLKHLQKYFIFRLKPNSRIFVFNGPEDFYHAYKMYHSSWFGMEVVDFEKLAEELNIDAFVQTSESEYLDATDWSVDSICVVNKDAIEILDNDEFYDELKSHQQDVSWFEQGGTEADDWNKEMGRYMEHDYDAFANRYDDITHHKAYVKRQSLQHNKLDINKRLHKFYMDRVREKRNNYKEKKEIDQIASSGYLNSKDSLNRSIPESKSFKLHKGFFNLV